ncbi:MAG: aldolase/citrate lyase family protein [Alphaproteobacteria bacterium]|nr:aldolase/citrate lyase family protein [Alphaproteobacteria bacterium]
MARINRAIELLEGGQPIFFAGVTELGFDSGTRHASTWADYLCIDLEHLPFDMAGLSAFMDGLIAAGPTECGHRTPTVIVTLPTDGADEAMVRTNSWMIKQALATGVHGLMLCHVEAPGAVRAFVECARYAFQDIGVGDRLGPGRRGSGGQERAAAVWGLSTADYLDRADVWPLNPAGELMLGLKIEDRRALDQAEACIAVPGIALAEWGPGDMGMSFGLKEAHDPPYCAEMLEARQVVKAACDAGGVAFLDVVTPETVAERIDQGVKIGAASEEAAAIGRRHCGRER